jgi:hypothetical protein
VGGSFIEPKTTAEPTRFDAEDIRANMIRRIRLEELHADGQSASLQLFPGELAVFVPR